MRLPCRAAKSLLPFQAERCLHVERIPSFLDGAFIFEIVDVETDVIDDVVAGIGEIGGTVLRLPIPDTSRI